MFRTFRNMNAAKSTGVAFIAALIFTGTAAADEFSKVTGNISGKVPLKIVILNDKLVEIGRTSDYQTGSFSISLRDKVSKYHWEAFAKGESNPCDKNRDVTASSITTLPRPHTCEPKAAAATGVQNGEQGGLQTITVTINNQSEVPVTVKFKDAANGDVSKPVKEKSTESVGNVKIDKSKQITWEATYNSKQCAIGIVSDTINVTKCGPQSQPQPQQQVSGGECSLKEAGNCPSRAVLELRKLRDQKITQLHTAEDELKRDLDAAKASKTRGDMEKALKQADQVRKRIDSLKKDVGELLPAEKIDYRSTLPKEYEEKNPFDVVYDSLSKTLCRGGKIQWDGSILSCQSGVTPESDRPILPATDISPNNPNAGR
jgi:hypothetical protein